MVTYNEILAYTHMTSNLNDVSVVTFKTSLLLLSKLTLYFKKKKKSKYQSTGNDNNYKKKKDLMWKGKKNDYFLLFEMVSCGFCNQ